MDYIVVADTDIGIVKKVNQDSLCVKTAETSRGKAALVMVCDGMGGLAKGELASAEVVHCFSDWFDYDLAYELDNWNWDKVAADTVQRIRDLNKRLISYGEREGIRLGTTATGMLVINTQYMIFHVGDTRLYRLSDNITQLTEDHTYVNREMKLGRMTPDEAKNDKRRNALIQCIGVTGEVAPEIKFGNLQDDVNYLVCSDGLRHVVTEEEIFDILSPEHITTRSSMQARLRELIELVKLRDEKDNITGVLFRAMF